MEDRDPVPELPTIFSDDEFAAAVKARADAHLAHDRWNPAAISEPVVSDGQPECTLEQQFPHVCRKVALTWGSDACAQYLNNLLICDRETRQGFPLDIVEDLLLLYIINEKVARRIPALPPLQSKRDSEQRIARIDRPQHGF